MNQHPYPYARRDDVVDQLHGEHIADPYRWLKDPESEATTSWSKAQDELFEQHRSSWPLRQHFAERVAALLRTRHVRTPVWRAERCFFSRRVPEQEHAVLVTLDPDGTERVLVDPMQIDPDGLTTLDTWQPSKDGRYVAYQVSSTGTEESVLYVLEAATGEQVDGPIDRCRYSPVAWLPDSSGFYVSRQLPAADLPAGEVQYHRRVWWHRLGDDPVNDTVVFGADLDKTSFFGVRVSLDARWLVVSASRGTAPRNDVWLADLDAGDFTAPDLRPVVTDLDARTDLWVGHDGVLYVHTDHEAPRGRLLVGDPQDPDPAAWREVVAQDDEAVLEDVAVLELADGPRLLCAWTRHAVSELSLHDPVVGARLGTVDLPGLGTVGGLVTRPEGGSQAWFTWTDHVTPPYVLQLAGDAGTTRVHATAPGNVPDTSRVRVEQVTYDSYDGQAVRMFVLTHTDAPAAPLPRCPVRVRRLRHLDATVVLSRHPRLARGRRRLRGGQPAWRRRGG